MNIKQGGVLIDAFWDAMYKLNVFLDPHGNNILMALLVLFLGYFAARFIRYILSKILLSRKVDKTISVFVLNIAFIGMLTFVFVATLERLGVNTASFVVVLGAVGLAIGFALQSSLSNVASGFLLIIFRPFKLGDSIQGGGVEGIVEKIEVFTTTLITLDNKKVIVPNAKLMAENITNFSANTNRRVDITVGVSYADNIDKVREVLQSIVDADKRILKDPPPDILVGELANSSVNFAFRCWVKSEDYWDVFFANTEAVKKRFDEEGISIPFPQQDVHLFKTD